MCCRYAPASPNALIDAKLNVLRGEKKTVGAELEEAGLGRNPSTGGALLEDHRNGDTIKGLGRNWYRRLLVQLLQLVRLGEHFLQ